MCARFDRVLGLAANRKWIKVDKDSAVYSQLIKDCYWDCNVTVNDIMTILQSDDFRQKQSLFSKIIYNSTDKARTLQVLFNKEMLQRLFSTFESSYNHNYIDRYILILRNILLGENNHIESLAWKIR